MVSVSHLSILQGIGEGREGGMENSTTPVMQLKCHLRPSKQETQECDKCVGTLEAQCVNIQLHSSKNIHFLGPYYQ